MSQETIRLSYQTPRLGAILAAKAFDGVSLLLFSVLLSVASLSILGETSAYKEASSQRETTALASGLYRKNEEKMVRLDQYLEESGTYSLHQRCEELDQALETFYTVFLSEELEGKGEQRYLEKKASAQYQSQSLFSEAGERLLLNADYDAVYYSFYKGVYESDALPCLSLKEGYAHSRDALLQMTILTMAITLAVSHALLFLLVPLLFRRGKKTFGMLLTRLGYIDKRGLSCSAPRFLLRYFFVLVFLFFGSFLAFFIPLAIDLSFLLFRKDRANLASYLFGTLLVENKGKPLPLNQGEVLAEKEKAERLGSASK